MAFVLRGDGTAGGDVDGERSAYFYNAWIVSGKGEEITFYADGEMKTYKSRTIRNEISNVLADVYVENGYISTISVKNEKIGGKVLSATTEYVEIEGYGRVPLDENYRIYQVYDEISQKNYGSLIVGYDLQEFIVANGSVCGAIITKPVDADKIRVLIKTTGFASITHESITLVCDGGMKVEYYAQENKMSVFECSELVLNASSDLLAYGRVTIAPVGDGEITVSSIARSYGSPHYEGTLEIIKTEDGLVLVNEVAIESYLKRVVPSEMPVGFGIEALKVQAVCARSYAYRELENNNYVAYGAHVDDSTLYQVYNNVDESNAANEAILQTAGQVLSFEGELVQTFYYSTSCGVTTDVTLWGSDSKDYPYYRQVAVGSESFVGDGTDLSVEDNFVTFIKNVNVSDYDYSFDLYRWQLTVSLEQLGESFKIKLSERAAQYPKQIGLCDDAGDFLWDLDGGNAGNGGTTGNSGGCWAAHGGEMTENGVDSVNGGTVSDIEAISDIGTVNDIVVLRRVTGGACISVMVKGSRGNVRVDGEGNIRYLFGVYKASLVTFGGKTRSMSSLPSTFCIFEIGVGADGKANVSIIGGGYGHGIGMSQNAVSAMCNQGMKYDEVLEFFYPGTQLADFSH